MVQTLTVYGGYEVDVLQSSSPPNAEQLSELSVQGWTLVTILHMVEAKEIMYLTYLSRPKRVH